MRQDKIIIFVGCNKYNRPNDRIHQRNTRRPDPDRCGSRMSRDWIQDTYFSVYGFGTKDERELFRLLIGVSGIGAATARMMLSSLTSDEIRNAIIAEDINRIKSIKGIGLKSAQRLILELKDKVVKGEGTDSPAIFSHADNSIIQEATTALVLLGFTKANVNKAVSAVLKEQPDASLEMIIKLALKRL